MQAAAPVCARCGLRDLSAADEEEADEEAADAAADAGEEQTGAGAGSGAEEGLEAEEEEGEEGGVGQPLLLAPAAVRCSATN